MTPVGRETMDAIENELGMKPRKERSRPLRRSAPMASSPEISVEHRPVGRETLAAIAEEALTSADSEARDSLPTLPYGDRLSNAPGAVSPSKPPSNRGGNQPQIEASGGTSEALEIFEMMTFVVRNPAPSALASDAARRQFVQERLAQRLPRGAGTNVTRIDVTPWTERDTVIVRVWCKLEPNS